MSKKYIYTGIVKDVEDPLMLNRVRIFFDTTTEGLNNTAILDSVPNTYNGVETKIDGDLKPEFKWSTMDPFCFLPLLPLFVKVTPKVGESVNVIWPNPDFKFGEQYYIQGTFSSPLTMFNEQAVSSRMFATKNMLLKPSVNLKNPKNAEYYQPTTKGVFPEPEDSALLGRGTCDIIVRDNDVIIRAGKSNEIPTNRNSNLSAKKTRSFIQLSNFTDRINFNGTNPEVRLEQNVQFVKTLIEWNILRPENQADNFDLEVYVYGLPETSANTTNNITISSSVSDKSLITKLTFNNIPSVEVIKKINEVIKDANKGKLNIDPYPILKIENAHPIIFKPSELSYKWISTSASNDLPEYKNISNIANKIKFKKEGNNGFGLIFFKDKTGQQTIPRIDYVKDISRQNVSTTYGVLGADKLVFLSHESQIPDGQRIFLNEDTLRGISQEFLAENVIPNTNSFVRGEELVKFLNLVIRFLISHVHAFPGLPPIPIATDGTSTGKILSQLQNAGNTILNKNIRIN
jgi:hypothetical protein